MVDYFERHLALDMDGKPVPFAEGVVYDETGVTPLAFTVDGVPQTVLKASANAIYPQFSVDGEPHKVMLVTPEVSNLLTSDAGRKGPPGDPGPPGAGVPPLETGVVGQFAQHAGTEVLWGDAPSGGGTSGPVAWGSILEKPSAFPAEAHVHVLTALRRSDNTALLAAILTFLQAGDIAAARAAIQAAPASTVSFPGFGSTPGLAMRGDRQFDASEILYQAGAGGTVDSKLTELAAQVGTGAAYPKLDVWWAGGAYPNLPALKPNPAINEVIWYGPVGPTAIPAWVVTTITNATTQARGTYRPRAT